MIIKKEINVFAKLQPLVQNKQAFEKRWTLLKQAEIASGFIAGGYARDLYLTYLLNNNEYVGNETLEQRLFKICDVKSKACYDWSQDIDFFFQNEQQYQNFKSQFQCTQSPLKCAHNMYYAGIKCQFIDMNYMSIEDRLNEFDLLPCKIAITPNAVYVDDRWLEFENQQLLHVDRWTSTYTLKRMNKYMNRGFKKFSADTATNLVNIAATWANNVKTGNVKFINEKQFEWQLFNLINQQQDMFSADAFLKLSMINLHPEQLYNASTYSYSVGETFSSKMMKLLCKNFSKIDVLKHTS